MKVSIISFTRRGAALAARLARALPEAECCTIPSLAAEMGQKPVDSLHRWTGERFTQGRALVFVSAAGIAVRAVAPFVKDKFTDPAVVSLDEGGRFVQPLLSGHVGGANRLAQKLAAITGGTAVISTATDLNSCFAVDRWATEQGLILGERALAKEISAALLEGEQVGFSSDFPVLGERPPELEGGLESPKGILLSCRKDFPWPVTLHLWPRALCLGMGCKTGLPPQRVGQVAAQVLEEQGLAREAVGAIATLDRKAEDEGLRRLAEEWQVPLCCYSPEELAAVEGEFTVSPFVRSVTGVDNVCERAAVRCAEGGRLLVTKQAGEGVTVAAAVKMCTFSF